jgi:hypothetical protein
MSHRTLESGYVSPPRGVMCYNHSPFFLKHQFRTSGVSSCSVPVSPQCGFCTLHLLLIRDVFFSKMCSLPLQMRSRQISNFSDKLSLSSSLLSSVECFVYNFVFGVVSCCPSLPSISSLNVPILSSYFLQYVSFRNCLLKCRSSLPSSLGRFISWRGFWSRAHSLHIESPPFGHRRFSVLVIELSILSDITAVTWADHSKSC